jgi:threonine dehydrogenase-like Zn-dependent dehydrogenase
MAETGQLAAWVGREKGFEIREYPVPDPAPGAALIKVALANVRGSDMHITRGAIAPD